MLSKEIVIERLKTQWPASERDLLVNCRFPIKYLGDGAYREAYQITGTNLIIKLPMDQSGGFSEPSECLEHARQEIDAIKCINRKNSKYKFLHPFMPEVYYTEWDTGLILMKKYRYVGSQKHLSIIEELESRMQAIRRGCYDISNSGNWAQDEKGKLKLIDFGCFFGD